MPKDLISCVGQACIVSFCNFVWKKRIILLNWTFLPIVESHNARMSLFQVGIIDAMASWVQWNENWAQHNMPILTITSSWIVSTVGKWKIPCIRDSHPAMHLMIYSTYPQIFKIPASNLLLFWAVWIVGSSKIFGTVIRHANAPWHLHTLSAAPPPCNQSRI